MRLLPVLLLAACTTPSSYGQQAAKASCQRAETCDPDAFEAQFDDVDVCADQLELFFGGDCYVEHCETFVVDEAMACLAEIRDTPCAGDEPDEGEDGTSRCDNVWVGCDPAILLCLADEGLDLGRDATSVR